MCQVNIALGILYLGLPESRYREKLIETILGRLADSGCDEIVGSTPYQEIMGPDNTFADHHHYILGWVGEVTTKKDRRGARQAQLSEKWIKLLDDQDYSEPQWLKRDRRYWWYRSAGDKWWTLLILVILPILGMWLSEFHSTLAAKLATTLWIALGFGQLSIVMHVLVGRRMATRIGRQIEKRSEYMSRKLNERSAADEMKRLLPTE